MGELDARHEREVALVLPEGRVSPASGSRTERLDVHYGLPADVWRGIVSCKSARVTARSAHPGIRFTEALWREAELRALEAGVRPAMALRLYGGAPTAHLVQARVIADVFLTGLHDYAELLAERNQLALELAHAKSEVASLVRKGEV